MNLRKLFLLLNENKVKYVVIGASAMPVHGFSRHTKDLDIMVEASERNIKHLQKALKKFGYDLQGTTIKEFLEKKILLRQYLIETDIHPHVKGASWKKIWKDKIKEEFDGVPTFFASLNDLIRMKRAAGRPKDLDDLRYLEEIRRQKKHK